ncbi:aspartate carbamoyltransferase [Nitrosospira multiformis]|nr:aspartate carbamoyltransferase [Nitrosospira multiformis]
MNFFTIPLLIALFTTTAAQAIEKTDEKRLDEVAERGTHVMPFDLEKTTHVFSKTPKGGVQQVVVKGKSDTEKIRLIRVHLSEISNDFKHGDFSKPARIHGEDMPGLAELKSAKPGEIKIEYAELPDGAQISYSTSSPKLINAIHRWFDAQLSDHARHAVPGHPHRHMPHK